MIIIYNKRFLKRFDELPLKIQEQFNMRITLFTENKFHPLLNNHTLSGVYRGCRSINISGDLRAVFREDGETVVFICLGTHSQLYG